MAMMYKNLSKDAIEIPRTKVTEIYKRSKDLLNELELELNEKEVKMIRETIKSKCIPTPKLLLKDQKDLNTDGLFKTRFLLSAANLNAGFPKLGYTGIKKVFERNNVSFDNFGIKHNFDVKEKLENLQVNLKKQSISKLDIVDMYPSVKIRMIWKAVNYYARGLPSDEKKIIETSLKLIEWGMNSALCTFDGKYYEYGRIEDLENKGISIGAYEGAFLADLVANFVYAKTAHLYKSKVSYMEIFRNDSLQVWKKIMNQLQLDDWLVKFQAGVDKLLGSDKLKFTIELWEYEDELAMPMESNKTPSLKSCLNLKPGFDMGSKDRVNDVIEAKAGKRSDGITWLEAVSKRRNTNRLILKKYFKWSPMLRDKVNQDKILWDRLSSDSTLSTVEDSSISTISSTSESSSCCSSYSSNSKASRKSERISRKRKRIEESKIFHRTMMKEVNGLRKMVLNLERNLENNNQNKSKRRKVSWWDQKVVDTNKSISTHANRNLPSSLPRKSPSKVSVFKGSIPPFLDLGLKGNRDGSLEFIATNKEGQLIKYVSSSSDHTIQVLKAIPLGVLECLAKLTSFNAANKYKLMQDLYPMHTDALVKAGLLEKDKIPTLNQVIEGMLKPSRIEAMRERERDYRNKRNIFFSIPASKLWPTSIWKVIMKLRNKHNVRWLRIRMSYTTHMNFLRYLQGDLKTKMNKGWHSLDYMSRLCNCNKRILTDDGNCLYDGKCRNNCIVYKVICKETGKFYIGSTAKGLKEQMKGHYNDVKKLLDGKENYSDMFSKHFEKVYREKFKTDKYDITKLRTLVKFEVLWMGNPLSTVGIFGTHYCRLCSEEKLAILFGFSRKNCKMINKCGEIYNCCRHKVNFHHFCSTDELMRRKGIWFENEWSRETRRQGGDTKLAVGV